MRRQPRKASPDPAGLPPIFDSPHAALWYEQRGRRAAFHCPLEYVVKRIGFSNPGGWHPFVAALQEYEAGESSRYEGSVLKKFYEVHQPENAAEAYIGFQDAPEAYLSYPAHLYNLRPWVSMTLEQMDQYRRRAAERDNREHNSGQTVLSNKDGFKEHGPVSERKGQLEYKRLVKVYNSIKANGYDRSQGHAYFLMLQREKELRFMNGGQGVHRTAAMVALGYETIPAMFSKKYVVDVELVDYWPKVREGIWTCEQAEAYFHHLFDFDSRAWAREQGLLSVQDHSTSSRAQ